MSHKTINAHKKTKLKINNLCQLHNFVYKIAMNFITLPETKIKSLTNRNQIPNI